MSLLSGLRVVDFTAAVAGPYCTQLLADLGAEVIKIEPPRGDQTRNWGSDRVQGLSYLFMAVNRNKKSVVAELTEAEQRAAVHELIRSADIVIESFAPGGAEKLGVDHATATSLKPDIVYCSISGYGRSGPLSGELGMDMMLQASSGIMSYTGEADRPPVRIPVSSIDLLTGSLAFGAILAALRDRDSSGEGQYVELSLFEAAMNMLSWAVPQVALSGREPTRFGGEYEMAFPYGVFAASDEYFYVGVSTAAHWERFCAALDLPDLHDDPRYSTNKARLENRDSLREVLAALFATRTAAEWESLLKPRRVAFSRIRTVAAAIDDEHATYRRAVRELPGIPGALVPATPFRLDRGTVEEWQAPPALGEHTHQYLGPAQLGDSQQ